MNYQISEIAKPLKAGMAALLLALISVVVAFNVDYQADNILAYVCFWLVAATVFVGFFSIAWGIWVAVKSRHSKNKEQNNE